MGKVIHLISDEVKIYISNFDKTELTVQKNSLFPKPFGKFTILVFYNHFRDGNQIPPLIQQAVDQDVGVVYLCNKLPHQPIIHPNIVYLEVTDSWFLHTLFHNPLNFSATYASRSAGRSALAFSSFMKYNVPILRHERDFQKLIDNYEKHKTNILVEITGGVGDHLLTIPSIKTLASKGYTVSILCEPHRNECFQNLDYIKNIYSKRNEIDVSKFKKMIYLHFGQLLNDYRQEFTKQNRIYAVAELCGLSKDELVIDKPEIILTKDEQNNAHRKYSSYKKKIFLGYDSARIESKLPNNMAQDIINKLKIKGFTVFTSSVRRHSFTNCIDLNKQLSVRELFGLINEMEAVLTIDTAFLHIAGAFNKKIFCLMSNFLPEWRTSTYKNCVSYTPKVSCFPCISKQFVASKDWGCHKKSCYEYFNLENILQDVIKYFKEIQNPALSLIDSSLKTILVKMLNGELGDKLVFLGVISEFKRKYADYKIDIYLNSERYSKSDGYASLFQDCVDKVYTDKNEIKNKKYGKILEVSATGIHNYELDLVNKNYMQLSRYQIWAKQLGFNFMGDVNAEYKVRESDRLNSKQEIDILKLKTPIVGIAPLTSNKTKNWQNGKDNKWQRVIDYLHSKNITVVSLHSNKLKLKNCINLGDLTIRQLGYVVSKLDLLISCEAGVSHFAGILNIPTIVLLGSSSPLVLRHYKNFRILHAGDCYSCNRFIKPDFDKCKCGSLMQQPNSECLINITVPDVLTEIKNFKGKDFYKKYKVKL